ncbi:uncharacterized protein LOC110266975 [Arachis ipaensis]|uniref:uncharacterized protein LOC110266975 n=1 Tax=Arachis ipaensis TaxID=130454 RepID=UPI000A2B92E2|nr:uncharacterized protein LOC110266975 [Arachis ipaensis]
MPRRSTTTKKSETGTRRKKTLEELESWKVIECRCSYVSIFTTINSLTKEQKLEVDKMGFSSMKAIQDWKIDRRLFLALSKAYNTTTSKLELVVRDIDVTTDKIGLALGLPSIGKSFPEEEDWTSEQKRLVAPFKSVTSPWLQEVLHSRECNVSTSKGRDYFRRAFTMFIISLFLAPTSSAVTSPKHLRAIVDVENITRYNWARFVHDELMKGVQKFKEKNTLSIDGCLYVLMIIYYHKDTFGDKENYMGPPPPWIAYWDKEKLAKKLTQESSKQRPTVFYLKGNSQGPANFLIPNHHSAISVFILGLSHALSQTAFSHALSQKAFSHAPLQGTSRRAPLVGYALLRLQFR